MSNYLQSHGHIMFDTIKFNLPDEKSPSVLDVFAGAGGISMGFIGAGYRIAGAVEKDKWAAKTFKTNIEYFQGMPCSVHGGAEKGDMTRVSPEEIYEETGDINVLVGGPPCKAFSQIGRGKLNSLSEKGYKADPRNKLYHNFVHFLEVFKPDAFVMENVPGMLSIDGRNLADVAARHLGDPTDEGKPGYVVRYAMLDSSWYGVPQYRQRIIFIGIREDLGITPSMPPRLTPGPPASSGYMKWPEHHGQQEMFRGKMRKHYTLPVPAVDELASVTTVRHALGDLPEITDHIGVDKNPWPRRKWNTFADYPEDVQVSEFARVMREWDGPVSAREGVQGHHIRWTRRDFETFRRMAHGETYPAALKHARLRLEEHLESLVKKGELKTITESAREQYRPLFVPPYDETRGFSDSWQKLYPERPSWTVTAHLSKDTYSHIHFDDDQARAISVREAARLQSFPDRFILGPDGGLGGAYGQIGNAVPPLMAHAIAKHLKTLIFS